MNNDLGYGPENTVYAPLNDMDDSKTAKLTVEFKKLPHVMAMGLSSMDTLSGYGDFLILDNEKDRLLMARQVNHDADYLSPIKILLLEGQSLKGDGDILVGESFVSKRGWTDGAIGKYIYDDEGNLKGKIMGVAHDLVASPFFTPQLPVTMPGSNWAGYYNFTVRVSELTPEYLREMSGRIVELLPDEDVGFTVLKMIIEPQYKGTRHFRNGAFVASIAILLITLIGLLGYTTDGMHRRSKEITIRKVNGATAPNILRLLSKDASATAFLAILLGVIASRVVRKSWLRQFTDKIPLTVSILISTALLVLAIVQGCVILESWNIANEDPVRSIKNE